MRNVIIAVALGLFIGTIIGRQLRDESDQHAMDFINEPVFPTSNLFPELRMAAPPPKQGTEPTYPGGPFSGVTPPDEVSM